MEERFHRTVAKEETRIKLIHKEVMKIPTRKEQAQWMRDKEIDSLASCVIFYMMDEKDHVQPIRTFVYRKATMSWSFD